MFLFLFFMNCINHSVFLIHRDGPLLVVASGRDTISVATSIKRLALENVFLVQVKLCTLIFLFVNSLPSECMHSS